MSRTLPALLLTISLVLGACGGDDPESRLASINDLMAKDFPLTEQQAAEVEEYLQEGNELAAAGEPDRAVAAYDKAIEVLKFAEDAAMFNKSE